MFKSEDEKEALELIQKLMQALSVADPMRSMVNHELIQRAYTFLENHGGNKLTFE